MSRIPRFEYRLAPVDVYVQGSASFLMTSRDVETTFPAGIPVLSHTRIGVTMRLAIGDSIAEAAEAGRASGTGEKTGPEADVDATSPPPARRRCGGLVWIGLHPCHPHFAALRRAREQPSRAAERAAYADFDERLASLCDNAPGPGAAGVATLVDELLARAVQLAGTPPVVLDGRIRQVMQRCDAPGRQDIHDMAREVGLSTSRLSHLFSSEAGMSFRQYLLWARTVRAWRQVALDPERSLTHIAHDLQFADAAHMSRSFKAIFGYPPSALREPGRWRVHQAPALTCE